MGLQDIFKIFLDSHFRNHVRWKRRHDGIVPDHTLSL
jgi:hypothetical protein